VNRGTRIRQLPERLLKASLDQDSSNAQPAFAAANILPKRITSRYDESSYKQNRGSSPGMICGPSRSDY
jgi:hypothetical protein